MSEDLLIADSCGAFCNDDDDDDDDDWWLVKGDESPNVDAYTDDFFDDKLCMAFCCWFTAIVMDGEFNCSIDVDKFEDDLMGILLIDDWRLIIGRGGNVELTSQTLLAFESVPSDVFLEAGECLADFANLSKSSRFQRLFVSW